MSVDVSNADFESASSTAWTCDNHGGGCHYILATDGGWGIGAAPSGVQYMVLQSIGTSIIQALAPPLSRMLLTVSFYARSRTIYQSGGLAGISVTIGASPPQAFSLTGDWTQYSTSSVNVTAGQSIQLEFTTTAYECTGDCSSELDMVSASLSYREYFSNNHMRAMFWREDNFRAGL